MMPGRESLRPRQRLDYKVLHNFGTKITKRVLPNTPSLTMDLQKLVDDEKRAGLRIDRYVEEYELELLFDIDEIEEGIKTFKELLEDYEALHVELERELGEEDYPTRYPNYETMRKKAIDWIKDAKSEVKRKKVERYEIEDSREESRRREEKNAQVEKARAEERELSRMAELGKLDEEKKVIRLREKLRTEEKYFSERMNDELTNIEDKGSRLLSDLESHLGDVKVLKTAHSELYIRIEDAYGPDFKDYYEHRFNEQKLLLNNVIRF